MGYNDEMKTETEVMKRIIKLAEQGDFDCQLQLAEIYGLGAVVERDIQKTSYWGLKAVTQAFINSDLPEAKKQDILADLEKIKA